MRQAPSQSHDAVFHGFIFLGASKALLISQSWHIQFLGYTSFQYELFLFRVCVLSGIGLRHFVQEGSRQPSHSYAATSPSFVKSPEGNGRGTSVQFFLLHAGSRHALQVLHSGLMHDGCKQSLQRSCSLQSLQKSLLHFSFLQCPQTRNVQEGHRKVLLSTSSSLHALMLV